MNLLADESVDQPIVERLRQDGHDVVYVAELSPSVSDDDVLRQANLRSSLLVTGDKDFGELIYRQRRLHGGVVLIRLFGLSADVKANIVADAFRDRGGEMNGAFTVISPGTVRIRRQP
jgi:predicted nuclease of predicted toxin-antitoxin system